MSLQRCGQRTWIAIQTRIAALRQKSDAGMVSAEYAVGILAAVAFALILLAVVKSGVVKDALSGLVVDGLSSR